MQISFGKLIQTKIYVNGEQVKGDEAADITNRICKVLKKKKGETEKLVWGEGARKYFEDNVPDYKRITEEDVFYDREKTPKANVTSVNIWGLGSERFLVTGEDIQKEKEIGDNYRYNVRTNRRIIAESHWYPKRQKKAAQDREAARKAAGKRHQDDLRTLFWEQGLDKFLEIKVKTALPPKKPKKVYEQISLFKPVKKPYKTEKSEQQPERKYYRFESMTFRPETLVAPPMPPTQTLFCEA